MSKKDQDIVVKNRQEHEEQRQLALFRSIPCFKSIGLRLMRRCTCLFEKVIVNDKKVLMEQGQPANKAFIILTGEFELWRSKTNKLTKKEMDFKKVKVLNQLRRSGNDKTVKYEISKIKSKLPSSQILMGRVGQGCFLGHDDLIAGRPFSKTVICKSKSAEVFVINQEKF